MATNFTDFGDLVLLIGDYHIPQKAGKLPPCFVDLLSTDKIRQVLCTGNVGSAKVVEDLRALAGSVHIVKGDMDIPRLLHSKQYNKQNNLNIYDFPEYKVINVGEFKIGLMHGHQIIPWDDDNGLLQWQRKLGCDVLVYGHTHKNSVTEIAGKFFINPGSATGASQPFVKGSNKSHQNTDSENGQSEETKNHHSDKLVPSFMLMAVQGPNIVLYVYEEHHGKATVVMSEFSKTKNIPKITKNLVQNTNYQNNLNDKNAKNDTNIDHINNSKNEQENNYIQNDNNMENNSEDLNYQPNLADSHSSERLDRSKNHKRMDSE